MRGKKKVREDATVIVEVAVDGQGIRRQPKPGQPAQGRSGRVQVREVDSEVLRVALAQAGGDYRRLHFLEDGSILVTNRPRGS